MPMRAILLLATAATLAGCATRTTPYQDHEAFCAALRAGLPSADPGLELHGRVTTWGQERFTHDIAQFGRRGMYHEYFVRADTANGVSCGFLPLYEISRAEYRPKSQKYFIILKNGKSFETMTSVPFSYRLPDGDRSFVPLVGGPDENSWFWYIAADPRFDRPISLRPKAIATLEVF